MKKVYIIHGWDGSPDEPLHKWLKLELESKGYNVIAPEMPNPEIPVIDEWVSKLNEVIKDPDEDSVLVGHSIGCQSILRYLEKLPTEKKIGGVALIAPWLTLKGLETEKEIEIAKPWLETEIKQEDIIKHIQKDIVAIFSNNDPFVPFEENMNLFKERFNAKIITEENKGHFTEEDKVRDLYSLLKSVFNLLRED